MRLAFAALVLAPGAAHACAVCGGGNPANRFAFFASTIALSLLPLGMFVGASLWLRSRLGRRFADEFSERDVVTTERDVVAPERAAATVERGVVTAVAEAPAGATPAAAAPHSC